MLPAWVIDKIKKDEELNRHIGEQQIDRPALEKGGIMQRDDTHRDFRFDTGC
jgi:hypothetical protein